MILNSKRKLFFSRITVISAYDAFPAIIIQRDKTIKINIEILKMDLITCNSLRENCLLNVEMLSFGRLLRKYPTIRASRHRHTNNKESSTVLIPYGYSASHPKNTKVLLPDISICIRNAICRIIIMKKIKNNVISLSKTDTSNS